MMKGGQNQQSTKMTDRTPVPMMGGGMQGGMIGKQSMSGMGRPEIPRQRAQPLPQPIQQPAQRQPAPPMSTKMSQPAMANPILAQNSQTMMQNKNNIGRLPVNNSRGGMGGGKSGGLSQGGKSGGGK